MRPFDGSDPKRFLAAFYSSLNEQLQHTDDDLATIIDRHHVPEIVQVADGHRMDRATLIAHARPVRKSKSAGDMDIHEAFADGERLAARYTLSVDSAKRRMAIEVHFFGRFAPDGRMREAQILTRTVENERKEVTA